MRSYSRAAAQITALRAACLAAHEIAAPGVLRLLRGGRPGEALRLTADPDTNVLPDCVVPVAPPGQERGGMGIFVPCGVEHGVVLRAQEVRQADLRRAVAPEAADAVLPPHLFGKREADEARVDAEIPVEPVIFFANFF